MTVLSSTDPRHGTVNGYNNLHCRCNRCVTAAKQYRRETDATGYGREWRHRTGRNRPREVYLAEIEAPHGVEGRYNRGCRCDDCREAATEARRGRRARAFERTMSYDAVPP